MEGNMNRVQLTMGFLKEKFDSSDYFAKNPYNRKYRMEHTIRVANIGKKIAENENLDVDALVVACLLHDVSYCEVFPNGKDDVVNHGRFSARIARPFVEGLGFDDSLTNQILYGIAIHVDGKSDFSGEMTALVQSVSDADNIDRFGLYRLHENLQYRDFLNQPLDWQKNMCNEQISSLTKYERMKFATPTATKMWVDTVRDQLGFYQTLLGQLENSSQII